MVGLPANIIKRFGVTKKAWAVYRSQRSGGTTTMAKKRKSGRSRKSSSKKYSSRGMLSGWLPLSMKEIALDFGVGLTVGKANQLVAPFTDGFLAFAGSYRGEARTALIGTVAYKFGSGIIKEAGKEYFRFAVMSAGAQTAVNTGIFNDTSTVLVDQY